MSTSTATKPTASLLTVTLSDPGLTDSTWSVLSSANMVRWLCENARDYTRADVRPVGGGKSVRYIRPLGTRDWELSSEFHDKARAPKAGDAIKGRDEKVQSCTKRDEDSAAYFVKLDTGMLACLGEKTAEGWTFGGFRG